MIRIAPHRLHLSMSLMSLMSLFAFGAVGFLDAQEPVKDTDKESPPAASSKWYGTLDAKTRQFRFEITFTMKNGETSGELLSLDEGGQKFPLAKIQWTGEQRKFEIVSSQALFEGKAATKDDGAVVQGNWKQRGVDLPLTLTQRDTPPQVKYAAIWKGEIKVPLQPLPVAFRILANGDVFFDSLKQKAGGFVGTLKEDGEKVVIEVPGLRGTFEGAYNDGRTEIQGKWRQGLGSFTLNLVKAKLEDLQTAVPNRPQTPKPPFPYRSEEVEFAVEAADASAEPHRLAGTLTLPKDPIAVVVMATGSGAQDRDETIMDHKPFWVIADHLGRNGIAVLRVDDRGVGKSTGNPLTATTADFANDAEAAVEFVGSHKALTNVPIGICGHSEGGLIAPMVAARNSKVAFIILMAGPGVNGEKIAFDQVRRFALAAAKVESADDAAPAISLESALKLQRVMLDSMKALPNATATEVASRAKKRIKLAVSEEQFKALEPTIAPAAAQITLPWFRFFATYEPTHALRKVKCPVLVMIGEKDTQVSPDLNLPPLIAALKDAGNTQVTVERLEGLNHLFQKCETGMVNEYADIEETIHPTALKTITQWIQQDAIK